MNRLYNRFLFYCIYRGIIQITIGVINQSFQETNKFGFSSKVQWFIVIVCIGMLFTACNKTDNYKNDQLSDYMPLQKGKYWIYQLDSTNYQNAKILVTHYQVKDVVDDQLTDNLNRSTYRIIRYIRPLASARESDWSKSGQFFIAIGSRMIETTDVFNFKYESLTTPFILDSTWNGNNYLPNNPYSDKDLPIPLFTFSVDKDMRDWEYTFTGIGERFTMNGKNYDNVVTVTQRDASVNLLDDRETPIMDGFASKAFSAEKYAKNIGLIYKKLELWEHQPASQTNKDGYYVGFGIELRLIDHN